MTAWLLFSWCSSFQPLLLFNHCRYLLVVKCLQFTVYFYLETRRTSLGNVLMYEKFGRTVIGFCLIQYGCLLPVHLSSNIFRFLHFLVQSQLSHSSFQVRFECVLFRLVFEAPYLSFSCHLAFDKRTCLLVLISMLVPILIYGSGLLGCLSCCLPLFVLWLYKQLWLIYVERFNI